MPRTRREISVVKIEYICDRCERGVYRLVDKRPVTTHYVHKWRHRCTFCSDLADFTLPYPLLEVDSKAVSHVFVQRETLPVPSGPSSQAFTVSSELE